MLDDGAARLRLAGSPTDPGLGGAAPSIAVESRLEMPVRHVKPRDEPFEDARS